MKPAIGLIKRYMNFQAMEERLKQLQFMEMIFMLPVGLIMDPVIGKMDRRQI